MTTRHVGTQTFNFAYDAENRLVSVSGDSTAAFTFNGDGQRVKSVMGGETTLFVSGNYEVTNPGAGQTITKYYTSTSLSASMAGATRVALRKNGVVSYMLADHLGLTSLVTDSAGNRTSELRYKPWGETRFSFGSMPTKYTFTGQFSYTDDPSTPESEGFGLMYYGGRWVDAYLNHFTQPDSIVPDLYNSQSYDRYSYARNNPINRIDPSGHIDFSCLMDGCPDDASTNAAIALGGLFNLGVLGDLQAAMEIVVANEYGDLIYRDDSERWPLDAAITRRYNEYCSSSAWSEECVRSFWGYIEIIRNSGKNLANVTIAKEKVTWYNTNGNVTNLASAILNPGFGYGGYKSKTEWQGGCFDGNGNSIGLCHWGTYSDTSYIAALKGRVTFDANGNGSNVVANWNNPLIVDYATYIVDLGGGFWEVITNEWQWQEDCANYGCYGQ